MIIRFIYLFSLILVISCSTEQDSAQELKIPTLNHDLGYIPYDAKIDDPKFVVCDSTEIHSGRNKLSYQGGNTQLREDCRKALKYQESFNSFTGFVMSRFIMNCDGARGRYRTAALHPDFSPQDCPPALLKHSLAIIKKRKGWVKSSDYSSSREYSKFINLKFKDGKIEHIAL